MAELRAEARHRKPDVILTHCSAGLGWPSFVTLTFLTGLGLRIRAPLFISSSLPGASAWDMGWRMRKGSATGVTWAQSPALVPHIPCHDCGLETALRGGWAYAVGQGKARAPKAGGQGHSQLSKQMVTKKNTKSSWVAVGYFN